MTTEQRFNHLRMGECSFHQPDLKLTSFDSKHRAESIRLAFHIGGIKFEDKRIARDEFKRNLKDKVPYGQLPILHIDGEVHSESNAILRYAGKLAGLYPQVHLQTALRVDSIVDTVEDVVELLERTVSIDSEKFRIEAREKLMEKGGQVHTLITGLNISAEKHGQYGFSVGSSLTIADLCIYQMMEWLNSGLMDGVHFTYSRQFPYLYEVCANVRVNPAVRDWNLKHNMPKLKLIRFEGQRGPDMIRLALAHAGIKFEDQRVTAVEFKKLQPNLPYGQLPVLKFDGEILAQSTAIGRFVGKLTSTHPRSDKCAAYVDEVLGAMHDDILHTLWQTEHFDAMEKKTAREKLVMADSKWLQIVECLDERVNALTEGRQGFLLGFPTIADFCIFSCVESIKTGKFEYIPKDLFRDYSHLTGIHRAVGNLPSTRNILGTH